VRHLDLFSGIGGFALAASWAWPEHKIMSFCEKDTFCQQVLKKHWPEVPIESDIFKLDGSKYGKVDLLTGGFPCQPFSTAGKRRGKKDDRHLWPEMFRVIKQAKPTWIIGENVAGIINMELDQVFTDLEVAGYATQSFIIPACAVRAPHKRERVWVCVNFRGNPDHKQRTIFKNTNFMGKAGQNNKFNFWGQFNRTHEFRTQKGANASFESTFCRNDNGVSGRLDRLKSLGNAIVPQVVYEIFKSIKQFEENNQHSGERKRLIIKPLF